MNKKYDYGYPVGHYININDGCFTKGLILDKTFDTDHGWMYKVDLGDGLTVWVAESIVSKGVLN